MGIWGRAGLGLLGLAVIGAIVKNSPTVQPQPAPPPRTEEEQAIEQCTAWMWVQYGHGSVSGPESDWWKVKKTGGIAALYTVRGRNAFGMPLVNTVECEESRDIKGIWQRPSLWNATMNGDRLDPSSIDERSPKRPRHKVVPKEPDAPQVRYDETGAETVTVEGENK